jgi:hypothetical protein
MLKIEWCMFNKSCVACISKMDGLNKIVSFKGLLILMLVFWLAACKKTGTSPEPGAYDSDYYSFLSQPADGYIMIQSYTTQAEQGNPPSISVDAAFTDANRNTVPGGPISVGNMIFMDSTPGGQFTYGGNPILEGDIYGQNLSFSFNPNPNGQVTGTYARSSIYVPAILNINAPSTGSMVTSGTTITWNADPRSPKYIQIILDYDPAFLPNLGLDSAYPKEISHLISVPDNGSYTFKSADFSGFPPACDLDVDLIRYNHAIIYSTDHSRKFLFSAEVDRSTDYTYSLSGK